MGNLAAGAGDLRCLACVVEGLSGHYLLLRIGFHNVPTFRVLATNPSVPLWRLQRFTFAAFWLPRWLSSLSLVFFGSFLARTPGG